MVTRKEVAELAGVSEATVSRVFNGVGPMKERTKQRVLDAARTLDYHPNAIAQRFARRRSGTLGVVLPYVPKVHIFSTYYFSEVLSGIGEQVKKSGYDMLLMFRAPQEESHYAQLFRSQKVDACIILGATDTPSERAQIKRLDDEALPYCVVNQHFKGERFNEIDANHTCGAAMAVRHLLGQGYRRIAFVNGSPEYSNSADRLRGYVQAMGDAGLIGPDVRSQEQLPVGWYYEGNYSRTSGYKTAQLLHPYLADIDAVFCSNDRMAIGLMQGLKELGAAAGVDYAIFGYDDSDAARMTDPPLSSVAVPFYEMGRLAAERLLRRIGTAAAEGGQGSVREVLDTRLVIRESCRIRT